MPLRILREGASGADVRRWQLFLIGRNLLSGAADGAFGPKTRLATCAFQTTQRLSADGIVGPMTFGKALLLGYDPGFVDSVPEESEVDFPPPPDFPPLSSTAERSQLFGRFQFEPAPTRESPEAIKILGDWETENIATVFVPQLKGIKVFGRAGSGRLRFHRYASDQLLSLWKSWEDANLLRFVLAYEGSYSPRFIRGSTKTLSNHAFGTAFDINARWNRLGTTPALRGQLGSVRDLVAIANSHGFYWGGHYKKRPDGMHFEVAKLL